MEIERYRTITIDLANDYTPLVRLNAGDSNGRILRSNVTDGGGDVDDLHGLTGKFTWNRNPGGGTAGGYAETTVATGSDTANGVRTVSFTAPVPPAMLADAGDRLTFGLDIMDADQTSSPAATSTPSSNPPASTRTRPRSSTRSKTSTTHATSPNRP